MTPVTADVRSTAAHLYAAGWSALPLPPNAKSEPPGGTTGYRGRYLTSADLERHDWSGNIAIRLPADVVGVDVDVYHGGGESLVALEQKYGPLPLTVRSTSREDGSGIAMFRVPVGTTLLANPARGIEMIQAHHRYMIVWPSIHPEGRVYQWLDDRTGQAELMDPTDAPLAVDELPELPWGWIEGLATTRTDAAHAATTGRARDFIERNTANTYPGALNGVKNALKNYDGSRHDTLVSTACWALREAAAGLYSADDALAVLHGWWVSVMDDPQRLNGDEFGTAMLWAVAQVDAEPDRVAEIRDKHVTSLAGMVAPEGVDADTGEITCSDVRNLPPEFWTQRPALEHIRRAAHSRTLSADALLVAMLCRVSVLTPPTLTLPAIVGSKGSLNLFAGIVAGSGASKTTTVEVADELLPIERRDIVTNSIGSGEGLVEQFFEMVTEEVDGKKTRVKRKNKTAAFVLLDEGQALAEMGKRSGSTLMPTLRSVWSGGRIGQANASAETHRQIDKHTYRVALLAGFQPTYAHALIADAEGGTPQRFVFAHGIDPHTGDGEWPGEIEFAVPASITGGDHIDVHPDVAGPIRMRRRMVQRGEMQLDELDSHADLVRLKVAALLGILDGRTDVTVDDWELAGQIMRTSNAVRDWIVNVHRSDEQHKEQTRTLRRVREESAVADAAGRRATESGARAIARKARREDRTISRREAHHATKAADRLLATVDEMLEMAFAQGWLVRAGEGFQVGEKRP